MLLLLTAKNKWISIITNPLFLFALFLRANFTNSLDFLQKICYNIYRKKNRIVQILSKLERRTEILKKTFYVDGACSGNPGSGGYGVVWYENNNILHVYSEFSENTTNNREELKALLYVIELAERNPETKFTVYSDSAYAINSITNWIYNWAKNDWKNSKKQTVENVDLMQEIYSHIEFPLPNLTIEKVSGHSGLIGNELADALATNNKQKYMTIIKKNNIIEF